MAKSATQAAAPVGHKAQRANRKPSVVLVGPPAPVQAPAQPAAVFSVVPQPAAPAQATPVAVVAQPAPVTVALRGGLAIASVKLTGKPYRCGAAHNTAWWAQCTQAVATGGGQAQVAALVAAGVPAIFVGYVVRRGYMQAA